jgi:hypothetical protein
MTYSIINASLNIPGCRLRKVSTYLTRDIPYPNPKFKLFDTINRKSTFEANFGAMVTSVSVSISRRGWYAGW